MGRPELKRWTHGQQAEVGDGVAQPEPALHLVGETGEQRGERGEDGVVKVGGRGQGGGEPAAAGQLDAGVLGA